MYRFINFNDEKVDSMLVMELTDLAKTLTRDHEYEIEIRVHSYISLQEKKIYISHFWNHRPENIVISGMKSDLFLRAFGNLYYTNHQAVSAYRKWAEETSLSSFAKQLFMLAEDLRIEELCKKERPGMARDFSIRRQIYRNYFETQLKVNLEKSLYIDALYNLVYLMLNADSPIFEMPVFNEEVDEALPFFQKSLEDFYTARNTDDIATLCKLLTSIAEQFANRDMLNEYFHLADYAADQFDGLTYSELLRKDKLLNDDISEEKSNNEEQVAEEEMKTWHRETKDPGKSFLQFDLQQGTQTDILANNAREGEPGDQALAIVQGSARKSSNKDFSDLESIDRKKNDAGSERTPYGKENKNAHAVFIDQLLVNQTEKEQYLLYKSSISLYQKKLKNIIDRTLEHKKTEPRSRLQIGRLDKKLLRFFTEEQPRLFYKKNEESREVDAVFTLLIDCSASMQDKMGETKRGIVLFHEALKSVKVPHEIIGFWEDANESTSNNQPNYFKMPISFANSLKAGAGPEIMKLEAEEDNRDGFAIRVVSERLFQRREKQKFLIMFSDGEPAALGYSQNGIVDTHEAVTDARRNGIEVFNIFLSNYEVGDEQKKVFQNIYGNYSIIVPSVDKLPELLFPLLKKLLAQSI